MRQYRWVSHEVLKTRSLMSDGDIARLNLLDLEGCVVSPSRAEEPIYAEREVGRPNFLFFYQDYLTRVGVRILFTEFQMSALTYLSLAPSQLHPNG